MLLLGGINTLDLTNWSLGVIPDQKISHPIVKSELDPKLDRKMLSHDIRRGLDLLGALVDRSLDV